MHTATLHVPASCRASLQCVLYFPQEERQGPGRIVNLSMRGCHIESSAQICPGMIVCLYLILPSGPQDIVVERALVTWARWGECGIQIEHLQPTEAYHLRQILTTSY